MSENARVYFSGYSADSLKGYMRALGEAADPLIDYLLALETNVDELDQAAARIVSLEDELEHLRADNRWIPVSERLPEDCVDVLVLWYWKDVPVRLFYGITRKLTNGTGLRIHGDLDKIVACWTHLLLLPEECEA